MGTAVERLLCFLARPYAGIELEITIATIQLAWGAAIIAVPELISTSQTFFVLSQAVSPRLIALPWIAAGSLTFVGIRLFYRGNRACAVVRWLGSLASSLLWCWTAVVTWDVGGSFLLIVVSWIFATADVRIMAGACRRMRH